VSNDWMIVNDELEKRRMEASMYNFEALFQHLAGETLKFFS